METKSCFICCVLMILVISSQAESDVKSQLPLESGQAAKIDAKPAALRAERGVLGAAAKGAALGAVAGGAYHMLKG